MTAALRSGSSRIVTPRGYRQIEHTADLGLEIWAESEEALLAEGARAVVEILTEGSSIAETSERAVELEAFDREDRLVRWLNEIIYLAVTMGFLPARVEVKLEAGGLCARLFGEAGAQEKVRTELKSATYHGLELFEREGRFEARVIIDV